MVITNPPAVACCESAHLEVPEIVNGKKRKLDNSEELIVKKNTAASSSSSSLASLCDVDDKEMDLVLSKTPTSDEEAEKMKRMTDAVRTLLECLGEDPNREGLLDTPKRVAKAMKFFTSGYQMDMSTVLNGAIFEENHDELVLVRDIQIFSQCEHHMVPFFGKMHIAYIPNGRVVGLSKLARIAEVFARRLQVQERLTKQVAQAVWDALKPQGVAVVCECQHMCMVSRGVQKAGSSTVTSCMLGVFRDDERTRREFLGLIRS
mmetsp:Transcript_7932/g.12731  ORF Transcript_7932/g.12731 Transcript_7932/m.12731 type:complete len:262 (+) Transcript_7932:320-1105(+)